MSSREAGRKEAARRGTRLINTIDNVNKGNSNSNSNSNSNDSIIISNNNNNNNKDINNDTNKNNMRPLAKEKSEVVWQERQ